ncbi:hypothetical protein Cni_G04762 [Canna indica]|uniref:MADS-box domain-containing protein n=1 Tax=Canna indica TaxID=4628 RepID=A0AAQ3Q4A0_9LILI|nr:hypothetical protein Cni_G04762 [Canna indica]
MPPNPRHYPKLISPSFYKTPHRHFHEHHVTNISMARKKVTLAWIANDATRRATFKKRRKGLMKKVSELATLCDVKACMIVYGPQDPHPEVWPPSPVEITRVLARFKSMPDMEQCKRMLNQEGFLRHRAAKLKEQLRKQERENRELQMAALVHEGLAAGSLAGVGTIEEATGLAWMVEMKVKLVKERIEQLRREKAVEAAAATAAAAEREKTPMEAAMEALQRQSWFMEVGMNTNEHSSMVFGSGEEGETLMPSYMEHSNNPWLDSYFPLN